MEIIFSEVIFSIRQEAWADIGAWSSAGIGIAIFIIMLVKNWNDIFIRIAVFIAIAVILIVPSSFYIYDNNFENVQCVHDVILDGENVPKGYKITEERGKVITISKYVTKEYYQNNGCELEE